jgi:nitrite reductase/ring-hydroxylating ferredoxin subunit
MSDTAPTLTGPDFTAGIALSAIGDGTMMPGHVDNEAALLARCGDDVFAIGAVCTHYGAALEQGMLLGDTMRCCGMVNNCRPTT